MIYERGFIKKEPILKGWSVDKKFRVKTESGETYLLRESPPERYNRRKHAHEAMKKLLAFDVPMPTPVEFGTFDGGVYTLETFIEGEDAEVVIPTLPKEEQYRFGIESGRILKKIHSIPAPETVNGTPLPSWEERYSAKIDRKVKMYEACPYKYENGDVFVEYVKSHRHLIGSRPQTYQHGDYHIGNMLISKSDELYVIDFDRDDYGDPWEEFNRIVWCGQKAPCFGAGMIDGYFDGDVPERFWQLLALYIANNTLSSLPWAVPFGADEVEKFLRQGAEILSWYDGMNTVIPSWYYWK